MRIWEDGATECRIGAFLFPGFFTAQLQQIGRTWMSTDKFVTRPTNVIYSIQAGDSLVSNLEHLGEANIWSSSIMVFVNCGARKEEKEGVYVVVG